MANVTLDRPLYTDRPIDDPMAKVVEEGSPDAHFVLGGPGSEIDEALAMRLGVQPKSDAGAAPPASAAAAPAPAPTSAPDAVDTSDERADASAKARRAASTKAVDAAPENK